jgi:hypothetical protein
MSEMTCPAASVERPSPAAPRHRSIISTYGTNYLAVGDNGVQAISTISAGASGVSGNHLRIDFPPEAPESLGSSKTVAEVPLTGLSYDTTQLR